jgi:hypothetical protein
MKLPYLLLIIVLLASCEKTLENVTSGYYEYDPQTKKFEKSKYKAVTVTEIPNDSTKAAIKYFPQDYFVPVSATTVKGTDYICIPAKDGILTIDSNDSVRFLHPYNSFLSRIEAPYDVLQYGEEAWFRGGNTAYRAVGGDTMKYDFGYKVYGIFPSKTGVWIASDNLYLVREEAIIRYSIPEFMLRWFAAGDSTLVGFSKTGRYVVREDGFEFKVKKESAFFPSMITDPHLMSEYFFYSGNLYAVNAMKRKMYCLADDNDYAVDFPFSQFSGISSTGELWSVGYADEYFLQVAEKDWPERVKNGQSISSQRKVWLPGYVETAGISYLRPNNEVVIAGGGMGVAIFKNDSLKRLAVTDCSGMKSFLELEKLSDDKFIANVHNGMWYEYLLTKPTLTNNGIQLNLFHTADDSDGTHWIADNGDLLGYKGGYGFTPDIEYDIATELKKKGYALNESMENRSLMLGSRVVVNKHGLIHIFGRSSLITFNRKTHDWKIYEVGSPSQQISYSKIYPDKDGYLWFEVEHVGIYLFNGEKVELMIPQPDPDFWQIDADRKLTLVKDGLMSLIDMNDMVPDYYPIIITYKIDEWLYNLNIMSAVVWRDKKPAVINSNGFFFF